MLPLLLSLLLLFNAGHGPILKDCALASVNEYIHHRVMREQQIVLILTQGTSDSRGRRGGGPRKFLSSWNIMKRIYLKPLPMVLKLAAQGNVLKHLAKLEQDGIIVNSCRAVDRSLLLSLDTDLWCIVTDSQK